MAAAAPARSFQRIGQRFSEFLPFHSRPTRIATRSPPVLRSLDRGPRFSELPDTKSMVGFLSWRRKGLIQPKKEHRRRGNNSRHSSCADLAGERGQRFSEFLSLTCDGARFDCEPRRAGQRMTGGNDSRNFLRGPSIQVTQDRGSTHTVDHSQNLNGESGATRKPRTSLQPLHDPEKLIEFRNPFTAAARPGLM